MTAPWLSVIIPAYNEEDSISGTLSDISTFLSQKEYTYEIILVNDGSDDSTLDRAREALKENERLTVINNRTNSGKGDAVKRGMLAASGKYRFFTDADNSTTIDHLDKLLPYFSQGKDIVIGSRAVQGATISLSQPIYRTIPGKIGNLLIQALALPGLHDTQCGFKGFTEKSARDIFSRTIIKGWAFDIEALFIGKRMGYEIAEIPVTWVNHPSSKVRFSSYFSTIFDLLYFRIYHSIRKNSTSG